MTTLAKAEGRQRTKIVAAHIDWIKFYLRNMRSENWLDMRQRAERQVELLDEELFASPHTKDAGDE